MVTEPKDPAGNPVVEGELLPREEKQWVQVENKNLISIMVLSMALARAVTGKPVKSLTPEQGKAVIAQIEMTMKEIFPDVANLILGMYGMELMAIMPVLKDPQKLVAEMIEQYNDNSDTKLSME